MSSCFPDPVKAKNFFDKLKELKDCEIVNLLQKCLQEGTILDSQSIKDACQKELNDRALSEFCVLLFSKCSLNIFGTEHIHHIFDCLFSHKSSKKQLKNYQVQLLLTIISAFPLLLRGSEEQFRLLLLEGEIPFNEQLIELLAKEGHNMSIKLSDIYSFLEEICLEGTRLQSKFAVSAIAALFDISEHSVLQQLREALLDSLCNGRNVPTVLQSLGCLLQHSVPEFEDQEKVIADYIVEKIFHQNNDHTSQDSDSLAGASNSCNSCRLKVFGLKALVKSFLPHKPKSLSRPINFVLDIIRQMLQEGDPSSSNIPCEDSWFIRLATAKSILRLSRKWNFHISPEIFRLTILTAKDRSPVVRESFARKIYQKLNDHALPCRYACAFSFASLDSLKDLRNDGLKYMEGFIREYYKGNQVRQTVSSGVPTNHPVYSVVYLVHVLAHEGDFPAPDCRDEKIYAQFLSPLFITLEALLNKSAVGGDSSLVSNASSYLRNIFYAIKKAEDGINTQLTPKLHFLADVGLSVLDSLNTNNTDAPLTPGLVLLPSSLYRSLTSEIAQGNAYPSVRSKSDSFIKTLVPLLKTEVSRIVNGVTECPQQSGEDSLRTSDAMRTRSNPKSRSANNLLINKSKSDHIDKPQAGVKGQNDTAKCVSETRGSENEDKSSHHGSVVVHCNPSAELVANRNSGNNPSIFDSAITPSLLEKESTLSCSREDAITNFGSSGNQSKLSTYSNKVNYTSKIIGSNSEVLTKCDHTPASSLNNKGKNVDGNGCNSKKEKLSRNRDVTRAVVKRNKRCNDGSDTSTPEVTNLSDNKVLRRSKRRKT